MSRVRLRGDGGEISLIGLLVSSALSLIILGAVLTTFENAQSSANALTLRNDNQQMARAATDELALQLRNLASPTADQPQAVDRALPYDLIFQDVDPLGPNSGQNLSNVRRERWCLAANASLYVQQQTWTSATVPAAPADTACPGPSWPKTRVVVERVRNLASSPQVPVFAYNATSVTDISAIHVDLQLDVDAVRKPGPTRTATGIFLRNQNRRPVASFTAVPTAQGIILNASASADPEGHVLRYSWLDGGTQIATGVTATFKPASGTVHQLSVVVTDPAGLSATAAVQTVRAI